MNEIQRLMETYGLNFQQSLFVLEYIKHRNGTKAARDSGYNASTENTFATIASENIRKPHIATAIRDKLWKPLESDDITLERIVLELGRLALLDSSRAYDENDKLIPIRDLDEDTRRCIEGIKMTITRDKDGEVIDEIKEYKFPSKGQNLDKVMKYLGGYGKHQLQEGAGKLSAEDLLAAVQLKIQNDKETE